MSIRKILGVILISFALIRCTNEPVAPINSATAPSVTIPPPTNTAVPDGYPVTDNTVTDGYPVGQSEIELTAQPVPPNPERELPAATASNGVVGGVLIQEIEDVGFIPLEPIRLILGEVLYTDTGQQAYVRANDDSKQAELFATGVFVFSDVPAGEYGLIVDLGFKQFIVKDELDVPKIFSINEGDVIDLGQVITDIHN